MRNCVSCGGAGETRATLRHSDVWECDTCGLVQCDPLPSIDSPSSGNSSILTEESFTESTMTSCPALENRYAELATARHEVYSRDLGKPNYRFLEIGCGSAGLAEHMRRLGVDYDGIDLDPRPVAAARERGTGDGLDGLRVADFMDDSVSGCWDVIFLTQVLEHITRPRDFLDKIARSLSPDGLLHLDVPHHDTLAGIPSRAARGIGARYGAIDWPHHSIAYRPRPLAGLLKPMFDVRVFRATPEDRVWGQAHVPSRLVERAYYTISRLASRESLLVAYGRRSVQPGGVG